jgi:hypothetical protein
MLAQTLVRQSLQHGKMMDGPDRADCVLGVLDGPSQIAPRLP